MATAGPRPGTSRIVEMVACLVDAARATRWSHFAELVLDLSGAMTVDVDDDGRAGRPAPGARPPSGVRPGEATADLGLPTEVLHPAPRVCVTLTFASEAARVAAAPGLVAIERILGATATPSTAIASPAATPLASTIDALPLSPRMREVAHLVVAGRSDKEIADELGVSYTSARSYVQRMCRSLGVSGRGGLLRRVLGEPAAPSVPRAARSAAGRRRDVPTVIIPSGASVRGG